MSNVEDLQEKSEDVEDSSPQREHVEEHVAIEAAEDPLYSAFSKRQRGVIVFLIALAAMFSPLSSFIYYPAITALAHDLGVTIEEANLGITTYMVISGIAPAVVADMADRLGRRPVYITALTIYFLANIGLALQRDYAALLVLRMAQSAGSSGVISLAYGVVADVIPRSERGFYVGLVLLGPNAAPSLGPVLGGILAHFAGWEWIFWFLALISGVVLCALVAYLPETARTVVGNGKISAEKMTFVPLYFKTTHTTETEMHKTSIWKRITLPNPITCLRVICKPDSAIIILINGIFYMVYCGIQATLSSLFIDIYDLNDLEAGLIYLPFGFGCVLGSFCFGKLMNYDFVKVSQSAGMGEANLHHLTAFPIERARFHSIWYPLTIAVVGFAGYGWTLAERTSMAAPLVIQFVLGTVATGVFNMCGTLLTDLHPTSPSTAQAALNLVRCALAAAGTAVLQLIITSVGVGWTFTIIACICLIAIPLAVAEVKFGPRMRSKRECERER